MRAIPRFLRPILLLCFFAAGGLLLLLLPSTTNCGGNSAALAQVAQIAASVHAYVSDSSNRSFRFDTANPVQRAELASLAQSSWLRKARFLVCTTPVKEQSLQGHRIIVVCDTPYRNVPRRWLWSAWPTYAAGFSDGTNQLISTTEFASLDRSTFVPLDELYSDASK